MEFGFLDRELWWVFGEQAQPLNRSWPSDHMLSGQLGLPWALLGFGLALRVLAGLFLSLFPGTFLFLRWEWERPVACTWFSLDLVSPVDFWLHRLAGVDFHLSCTSGQGTGLASLGWV